jgi:hypothetical protein
MQQVVKTPLEGDGSSAAFETVPPLLTTPLRRAIAARQWLGSVRLAGSLAACIPALWQLALLVRLYVSRVRYPLDIEWLEGAALYQAHRVMVGQPTYPPPDHGYFPLFHPLGYPTVLGLLGRITGLSYAIGRTFSLACFVVAALLTIRQIWRVERRELHGVAAGVWAVGCAAAAVPLFEGFYDLVREDILAILLSVVGAVLAGSMHENLRARHIVGRLWLTPEHTRWLRIATLSLVCTAIMYTRLPTVFFVVWVALFVFFRNWRDGVLLALGTATACGLVLVDLQHSSRGWYWMYTVAIVQHHTVVPSRFLWGLELIYDFAPFVAWLPLVALVVAVSGYLSARTVLWLGMLVAAIPASLLPFAKVGGFSNDFMPVAFFLGPATACLVADTARMLRRFPRIATATRALAYVGLGAFLLVRTYDPSRFLPTSDGWRKAKELQARLVALEGDVIAPRHPFVPISTGHMNDQFADMPYLDAAWAGFGQLHLGSYLDSIHAQWALVSGTEIQISAGEVAARYQLGSTVEAPPMVIGEPSTMRYLLRRQDDETSARVLFDFENAKFDGWTIEGDAFSQGPTTSHPGHQNAIYGAVGQRLANSYDPSRRDAAKGRLLSPPFVIDRPRMGLRVGGGTRSSTRVDLIVDGRVEKTATGIFQGSESMVRVAWDVGHLQGREARIMLVDEDDGSWGHLLCDHVVLY